MDARLGIDTVVLLAYFIGIVVLGLWAGRRNRNLEDFSLGSRSIPWWAVLASIIAAETSAATFLGTPAEGFKTRGYFYGQLAIGTVLAFVTIITTIYTAVGGIKAVVWTDVIQAVLMFSSVIFAIFLLVRQIPGGLDTVKTNLG